MDSRSFPLEPGQEVRIKPAGFSVTLINLEHQDFFSTVRQKMHWGLDPGNAEIEAIPRNFVR